MMTIHTAKKEEKKSFDGAKKIVPCVDKIIGSGGAAITESPPQQALYFLSFCIQVLVISLRDIVNSTRLLPLIRQRSMSDS